MVGAVRKYRINSGQVITVIQRIQSELLPIVRRVPGFVGFYAVNKDDTLVTINLSSDPRRIQEADAAATSWIQTLGPSVVLLSQEVIVGAVTVDATL